MKGTRAKILTNLLIIAIAATSIGTGINAYFSDSESITGLTFTTGYADLKLASCSMSHWYDTATGAQLGVTLPSNLVPGYQGSWSHPDGCIYLGNFGSVNLTVTAKITGYTETIAGLQDNVEMAIAWGGSCDPGGAGTGFHTLRWWRTHSAQLFVDKSGNNNPSCAILPCTSPPATPGQTPYSNYAKAIKIYLRMPSSVGNSMANGQATFNIQFDATQVP